MIGLSITEVTLLYLLYAVRCSWVLFYLSVKSHFAVCRVSVFIDDLVFLALCHVYVAGWFVALDLKLVPLSIAFVLVHYNNIGIVACLKSQWKSCNTISQQYWACWISYNTDH